MVGEVVEEEGNGRKAMDLASERKENGWTHMESAGCHGGLLSEGHRQYMKLTTLNEIFGANKGSGNGNKLSECEFQEIQDPSFWSKLCNLLKPQKCMKMA
ncbi:hypothetical protein VZT92_014431 [Zoarces viviparus]|uniref:Uncharacterized protein n=1 Tax=Zoarces viviparus TaxID=48416 RepID=A0AAW1EZ66_ZOAVI